MKKVVLVGMMVLSSLSLKAQQEVLDRNDFFENKPITNIQSIPRYEYNIERTNHEILKSSRICFGVGVVTSLLGGILYYNGTILKNINAQNPSNYYTNYGNGEMQSTIGGALLVIGTSFNIAATVEKFKWENQIAKESLENKLKQENNEQKIKELEKQLSNLSDNQK